MSIEPITKSFEQTFVDFLNHLGILQDKIPYGHSHTLEIMVKFPYALLDKLHTESLIQRSKQTIRRVEFGKWISSKDALEYIRYLCQSVEITEANHPLITEILNTIAKVVLF